jgi:mannan endo-1,4-beta-mannosidase
MKRWLSAVIVACTALAGSLAAGVPAAATPAQPFVTRSGAQLTLAGHEFRFAGTNNYYLFYQSQQMVDDVFSRAGTAGFTVLRTWGWSDIGALDGTGSVGNKPNGVYFQYWDGTGPAYNDGTDGLARLDYVIWKAGQSGIRLIIPFTNNWSDFGGMDQYVAWAGLTHHDDFYTDPTIRAWYQSYIAHLLNHVNPLTGLAYRNDPTVMAWELANEPRCGGSGRYPASTTCTTATITSWVGDMSRYIKGIDHHHLVGTGDEGFYCTDPASTDWTVNCGSGVDTVAFASLPSIDYLSYHLYPDGWGKDAAWATTWIVQHDQDAQRVHKPAILGEFGYLDKTTRNPVYQQWTDAFVRSHGTGLAYWMLAGLQDDGTRYPDYDGFTVYCPSPVCRTIGNTERQLTTGQRYFPPVADDDAATTPDGTAVTLSPSANDIAYQGSVRAATIDLDPATAGQQRTLTVGAGQFVLNGDGTVTFTPATGFHGTASAAYTITDSRHTASNAATIAVTVKPNPSAPIGFASFEAPDLDGWTTASWQTDAGTVSQETQFATDGSAGLEVTATGGGWFGTNLSEPVDISGKSALKVDLQAGAAAGTSVDIAIQNTSSYTWCQGNFAWVPQGTGTTFVADLTDGFSCDAASLTDIRAIWVYVGPGATVDLDNVRAE